MGGAASSGNGWGASLGSLVSPTWTIRATEGIGPSGDRLFTTR